MVSPCQPRLQSVRGAALFSGSERSRSGHRAAGGSIHEVAARLQVGNGHDSLGRSDRRAVSASRCANALASSASRSPECASRLTGCIPIATRITLVAGTRGWRLSVGDRRHRTATGQAPRARRRSTARPAARVSSTARHAQPAGRSRHGLRRPLCRPGTRSDRGAYPRRSAASDRAGAGRSPRRRRRRSVRRSPRAGRADRRRGAYRVPVQNRQ